MAITTIGPDLHMIADESENFDTPSSATSTDRMRASATQFDIARFFKLVFVWTAILLACSAVVLYGIEPLFQQREQRLLLEQYRADTDRAANEAQGLPGISVPTKAPEAGSPVAIIEISKLKVQQVVVEGVTPSQTQAGPGHVPGTAAPGQPGNAAVVGRRSTFGGAFGELSQLHEGDEILMTTTQGQSVYKVSSVGEKSIESNESADGVFGPSPDDRLTLVTSSSASPLNSSQATVVVATIQTQPFAPTPQGGRTDSQTGRSGDVSAWSAVLLSLLALVGCVVGGMALYKRSSIRVAYLLTTPALIVFVLLFAESASRLLPGWT